jgi:dihydroorotate dehydrogenase (fumarate)
MDLYLSQGTESFAEALTYLPEAADYRTGPEEYLEHLFKAKQALGIPVIASLNGYSAGGWVRYAREIEQAGADALELNMYFVATDPSMPGRAVEDMYIQLLSDIRATVKLPIAVKLSPFFSSLPNMAMRLEKAGARGLVLFNRFYQPDIDIEMLDVVPHLVLSTSDELRLPLRWIAILYGRVDADLALTTGVHTATDVVKSLLVGASVTMIASELLHNGLGRIPEILADLDRWLSEHEYDSVSQLEGSLSLQSVANPAAYERANYMRVLSAYVPGM